MLESRPGGTPLKYMPQLDGLRAIAVVGVWFEHWGIYSQPGFRWVEWGRLAIWLFFVLSGFLITGILLQCKAAIDARHLIDPHPTVDDPRPAFGSVQPTHRPARPHARISWLQPRNRTRLLPDNARPARSWVRTPGRICGCA